MAQNSTSVSWKVFAYSSVVFYPEGALRWCMGSKLSFLLVDGSGACVCPDDISGNQTQFGMLRF